MAISSMSRIDSEPEMAIAIFRLCLEEIIRYFYPDIYSKYIEKGNFGLGKVMGEIYGCPPLLDDDELMSSSSKEELCKVLIERGNAAVHGNDHGKLIDYNKEYRDETIIYFIRFMELANRVIKSKEKSK